MKTTDNAKGLRALLTLFILLGGLTGTLSLGWYFAWGENGNPGEYPLALRSDRQYRKTGDPSFKERAEIHRFNAATLSIWGFLSAQLMATAAAGLAATGRSGRPIP